MFDYVEIIPTDKLQIHLAHAKKVMQKIDPKDSVLLAAGLAFPNSIIWSSDRHLKEPILIKTVTTKELIQEYKKRFIAGL